MGWLMVNLGSTVPETGQRIDLSNAVYLATKPRDVYGNALLIACEFLPDDPSRVVRLPAEGQPQ